MSALTPPGLVFPDAPHTRPYLRAFEPFIAAQFSDREALEALFDEPWRLATAKAVYGKKMDKPRQRKPRVLSLFD